VSTIALVALRDVVPDFKQPERIRDSGARRRKLLADPVCRATGKRASDGHHCIFASAGGDDVEDNLIPLSHDAHMLYHSAVGEDAKAVAREIGLRLTPAEVAYVVGKLGRSAGLDYLRRRYCWSRRAWERRHGPLVVATPETGRFTT
jgi:hypothetical protein